MVRRIGRATSRQVKAYQRAALKSEIKEITNEALRYLARAVQGAAIEISNGLVEAGPIWSGRFASSWYLSEVGALGGSRVSWQIYRYSAKDFRVTSIEKSLKAGNDKFELVNTARHAAIAIDSKMSTFKHPNDRDPLKDPVKYGFRKSDEEGKQALSLRPDIDMSYGFGEKIDSMITAEEDWLADYALGGYLSKDLKNGVTIGFGGLLS